MTVLTIFVDYDCLTVIETYCGDDIKYVESFEDWASLMSTLENYFNAYAYIEIRVGAPSLSIA